VRGLLAAGTRPGVSGRIYNLASGNGVSVFQLVRTLARIVGVPADMEYLPERSGDVRNSWADISAARRDLEFSPETTLEVGLRETLRWFKAIPVLRH
ncbi:MAG TPA: LPS biosynthesis protein WbpP, partial [Planctomycetota bacterium]|nr:LPS biosynthesis protein WbpP [Planctomycetota bacterium]